MFLTELHAENFRSLEDVTLERMERVNVIIGPNNSGKSAIISTLEYLCRVLAGDAYDTANLVTAVDSRRVVRIRLKFKLGEAERQGAIATIATQAGVPDERAGRLLSSPFLRTLEYEIQSLPNAPNISHVIRTTTLGEDGKPGVIQAPRDSINASNPVMRFRPLAQILRAGSGLEGAALDVTTKGGQEANITFNFASPTQGQPPLDLDQDPFIPFGLLAKYVRSAFFFSPFRHSQATMAVKETNRLDSTGANLAAVLHTIQSNDRGRFERIEEFLASALPHLGTLHTPLADQNTEVAFRMPRGDFLVKLPHTGGGVEQLLMVATVLATTGDESSLFLEEPETHLHPSAQRYLLERVSASGRQVVLTTHSPVFVNTHRASTVFQVAYRDERTTVKRISQPEMLSDVLSEIGARNSDVLMSDGVVFVEGPSDRDVLVAWGDTLDKDLSSVGVSVIGMGGSAQAVRLAPVQASVLQGISQRSPIPHVFVLDRDERSEEEIGRVQAQLGDRVVFLQAREIENYLLSPRAILDTLQQKAQGSSKEAPPNSPETLEHISRTVATAAAGMMGSVLVKRIRARLPGFLGGLLTADAISRLSATATDEGLSARVEGELRQRLASYMTDLDLEKLVVEEQSRVMELWRDVQNHTRLAPGEEILQRVFEGYGFRYEKPSDTARLARAMRADAIPAEASSLVARAYSLGRSGVVLRAAADNA